MQSLLLVALVALAAEATTHGIDVAYNYPQSSWNCLHRDHGIDFAIVRCYQSLGHVDNNCASSVQKAWSAGMKHVDLYMFPCPKCGNAAKQVTQLHDYVKSNNVKFGMVWLDIEGPEYWMGKDANRKFYNELASTTKKLFNGSFGVYTNKNGWESIFGSWTPSISCQLWHAYWDNNPSLSGFTPFDGFKSRAMKQYKGDTTLCSMDVDLDAY